MSQKNVELVREALNAFAELDEGLVDRQRVEEFFAPDVITTFAGFEPHGSDSWVEMDYGLVYTVEEGLITRGDFYAPSEKALEAAGLSE